MKIRKAKKQIKKVVGYMTNGCYVVNVVSNPEYTGGSCVETDEDCYSIEIEYTRKKYGKPLYALAKYQEVFWELYFKIHNHEDDDEDKNYDPNCYGQGCVEFPENIVELFLR